MPYTREKHMRPPPGEGYIEDVSTAHRCDLRWARKWCSDRGYGDKVEGCFISFDDMPRLHLTMDMVYHIKFKAHKTRKYNYDHSIDMFCKLYGTDYVEDTRRKKPRHHLKFIQVDPLNACDLIHNKEER